MPSLKQPTVAQLKRALRDALAKIHEQQEYMSEQDAVISKTDLRLSQGDAQLDVERKTCEELEKQLAWAKTRIAVLKDALITYLKND
jgi:hypothetical protein